MHLIQVPGAYSSSSETKFKRIISSWPGVAVANLHVTRGRQAREVDLFVLSPGGAYLVEVKGTGAAGELVCNANWPWAVGAEQAPFNGKPGNPGQQANLAAKIISQQLSEAGGPVGFVPAYVALDAPKVTMHSGMEGDRERLWWNGVCHIVHMQQMPDLPISAPWTHKPWMTTGTVRYSLHALGVPAEHLPTEADLMTEGFVVAPAMLPPQTTRLPYQAPTARHSPTQAPRTPAPETPSHRTPTGSQAPRRRHRQPSYTAARPDPVPDGLMLPNDTEAWIASGMRERSGASREWEALYDDRVAARAKRTKNRRATLWGALAATVVFAAITLGLSAPDFTGPQAPGPITGTPTDSSEPDRSSEKGKNGKNSGKVNQGADR